MMNLLSELTGWFADVVVSDKPGSRVDGRGRHSSVPFHANPSRPETPPRRIPLGGHASE